MGIKTISSFFGHVVSLPNTLRLSSNVKAASPPPRPADGLACELRADKALRRTPPAPVSFPRSPAVPPQGAGSAHGSCPSNTALGPHRPCRGHCVSAGRSVPGARSLPPPARPRPSHSAETTWVRTHGPTDKSCGPFLASPCPAGQQHLAVVAATQSSGTSGCLAVLPPPAAFLSPPVTP